jgi:hypothetical protein
MNKEQQELIDEAYEKYSIIAGMSTQVITLTKEEFIRYIKTDTKFSEKWGLKIDERELIQRERLQLLWKVCREENIPPDSKELEDFWLRYNEIMSKYNIPTRLITITYNDKTIESYDNDTQ